MGLSPLNYQRYHFNFILSPICALCKADAETPYHFFFTCPAHQIARQSMLNNLHINLGIDTSDYDKLLMTILEGYHVQPRYHVELLSYISTFLSDTGRFI